MAKRKIDEAAFPHISIRTVRGESEPYIPGTGLAVWEIAWLGRDYKGDVPSLVAHLRIAPELIEEALAYAQEHANEIDRQVDRHVSWSIDDLKAMLPGIKGFPPEEESPDPSRS